MSEENQGSGMEADLVFGWERLRAERQKHGLSLSQVSDHLKITPRQIEAIERGDLSALPGAAFSRGFVRNYARFLRLDSAPFMALIDAADELDTVGIATQMYTPSLGRMPTSGNPRFSALPAALLVLLVAVVLSLGLFFHWFEARDESALLETAAQSEPAMPITNVQSVPVVGESSFAQVVAKPDAAASAPVSAMVVQSQPIAPVVVQSAPLARQSSPSAAQSQVVSVAAQPLVAGLPRIVLGFEGESWVEVRDASDKVVFARLSQAGVTQEVQGTAPFALVIGNAPRVKLSWKGKAVDLVPYTKGDVARVNLQ